jgi:transcriptional regulator with XRE-family HTH domain
MGYGGKLAEQQRARELRAQAWTLAEIAAELGVSKASVSTWVRDVEFTPRPRNRGLGVSAPHPAHLAKVAEVEKCMIDGIARIGVLSQRELLVLGLALYAGEGSKTDGDLRFSNNDPRLIAVFLAWLRRFFDIDESRLRVRLYLHADLDLASAVAFWSELTGIPPAQFTKPYRPPASSAARRRNRHVHGCASVSYKSSSLHRRVMGMVAAILSSRALPG